MPERDGRFAPTRWSVVARATSADRDIAREALQTLCDSYWWPLYVYLRRRGLDGDGAADMVQGLFTELTRANDRFADASPSRGQFRGWLLSALKFHLSHEREKQRARKRGGDRKAVPLDKVEADRRWREFVVADDDPERLFERAWAIEVLQRSRSNLGIEYERAGNGALFEALRGHLTAEPATSDLATLAARLGKSVGAVKTAAHRLRRDFQAAIRAEIRSTLDEDGDVEEELRALRRALSS